jgi:thiamine monophosphate kinase
VRIDLERVPVHRDALRATRGRALRARAHALADGEDHELLATLAPERWRRIEREAVRRFPELCVIGRVRRGEGLWLAREEGGELAAWDGKGGWLHGA